jgi:hypothetical protein
MIKVQNNTAVREYVPQFLQGLDASSLQDLSWTDPSLGVQDCAWYVEEDQSQSLGTYEEYGEETLTIDAERKIVISSKAVIPMSAEKIAKIEADRTVALQARKDTLTAQIAALQNELESLND